MLNYLMIASCYGAGCLLSFRLGMGWGMDYGIRNTIKILSKMSNKTESQLLDLMLEYRETLKAKGK